MHPAIAGTPIAEAKLSAPSSATMRYMKHCGACEGPGCPVPCALPSSKARWSSARRLLSCSSWSFWRCALAEKWQCCVWQSRMAWRRRLGFRPKSQHSRHLRFLFSRTRFAAEHQPTASAPMSYECCDFTLACTWGSLPLAQKKKQTPNKSS